MKKNIFFAVIAVMVFMAALIIKPQKDRQNSFNVRLPVPNTSVSLVYPLNGFYDRGIRTAGDSVADGGVGDFLGSLSVVNILPNGQDGLSVYTVVYKKQSSRSLTRDIAESRFNGRPLEQEASSGEFKSIERTTYYVFPSINTYGDPGWTVFAYGADEAIVVHIKVPRTAESEIKNIPKKDDVLTKILSELVIK